MAIYLDHAATTPLRPEALAAMLPLLGEVFGNPSSPHEPGRRARAALDDARDSVGRDLGADAREVVFTSGGTESINLAVKGVAWAGRARGNQLITSSVEHHAVLHAVRHLAKFGFDVVELPVDRYGRVDPDQLAGAISDRTILVSLMIANNEVGSVQPIAELVRRAREHKGVVVHLDAVQAAAWSDVDVRSLDADLVSLAGHKIEGPKGTGVLYVRRGTVLLAQLSGGSQERYRRAGTENVAGAVGFATALRLAREERASVVPRVRALRDRLREAILADRAVEPTGHRRERLPNHLSVIVRDAEGGAVANALDLEGIACSTGSACTSGSDEPSHVLTAMGYPVEEARGALRLTLGRTTTAGDIQRACSLVPAVIARVRAGSMALAAESAGLGG